MLDDIYKVIVTKAVTSREMIAKLQFTSYETSEILRRSSP
jgi:hypothetical protein